MKRDNITIRSAYEELGSWPLYFVDEFGEPEEVLTEQHHKDFVDIHNVIAHYDRTGLLNHVNNSRADYGDFTDIGSYQESLNTVIKAQESFDGLPSKVRERFGNDPGAFFDLICDPNSGEELVKLGIADPPKPAPKPMKVEVVGDTKVDSKNDQKAV